MTLFLTLTAIIGLASARHLWATDRPCLVCVGGIIAILFVLAYHGLGWAALSFVGFICGGAWWASSKLAEVDVRELGTERRIRVDPPAAFELVDRPPTFYDQDGA